MEDVGEAENKRIPKKNKNEALKAKLGTCTVCQSGLNRTKLLFFPKKKAKKKIFNS